MTTVLPAPGTAGHRVLASAATGSRLVVGAVVGCVVAAGLVGVEVPSGVVLVLVATGLLAGLPHGALDHLVAARLTGRSVPVVAAAYGAGALAAWLLLRGAGPVAIVAVLLLSAAHFGLGELEVVRESTGWRPSRAVALAVAVAGTGALLLPLARAGDLLGGVAASISPWLGTALASGPVRWVLVAVWAVGAVVAVSAAWRGGHRDVVVDVVLVGALGATAPPLLAFALWFGCWHGVRHCARMLLEEPRCVDLLARGRRRDAALHLARLAAWPSLAATLSLVVLLVLTATAADPTAALGGTLVVLLALTVPHMVVVQWLDATGRTGP